MKKSTKKQLLARILTAVMGLSLIGCAAESSPANAGAEETETGITKEETAVEQPAEETDGDAEIWALISSMTTEEKLAQMMIVALRSDVTNTDTATELGPDYTELLRKYDFGGVILFAGNIVDPAQTVTMTRGIQEAAMGSAHGIPMFICVESLSEPAVPAIWPLRRLGIPLSRRRPPIYLATRSERSASIWISPRFRMSTVIRPTRS